MWDWFTYFFFMTLLLVSYFFLYQYDIHDKKEKKRLLVIGLLPTFMLLAFRAESTGYDLMRYSLHVTNADSFSEIDFSSFLSEPIFAVVEQCANRIGGITAFILLTSLLEYFFVFLAFRSLHKNGIHVSIIFIFLFAFLILRSFNIVRNCIALTCAFCAYTFLFGNQKETRIKYWLYTILGLGIHVTSVMNIPIYLLCRVPSYKNKRQLYKKLFIRIFIIVILSVLLLYFGLQFFFDLFLKLTEERYNEDHFEQNEGFGLGNLLIRLPFLLFTLYSVPKLNASMGKKYIPYMIMLFIDILVSQLKYVSQDFERLAMFTGLGEIVLWGMLCMAYSQKNNIVLRYCFLLIGLGYYTYYIYRWTVLGDYGSDIGIMPYKTFLL